MALKNLESLVLRGVTVVANDGCEPKRIGTSQATGMTSRFLSLACVPSPSYLAQEPDRQLDERHFHDVEDADKRAGRSGSVPGVLASRSRARSLGMALRGQRQNVYRGRLLAIEASIALQSDGGQQPAAMRTVGNSMADWARFEPDAGAFTVSTRGER